jgi:hypothetical protein
MNAIAKVKTKTTNGGANRDVNNSKGAKKNHKWLKQ